MVIQELVALLLYLGLVVLVGIYFFVKDRKNATEKDYFLGGRNMGGWVSALSAGASDMSAWVLMGLPGSIYLYGVGQLWIAVGLFLGTVLAWLFVAPPIRRYSIVANDSITIPQFLNNRFCTEKRGILVISAVVFMITYCIYAASSIYACGTLFNTVLGMNPKTAMIIASSVIVLYTFLGGYNAVCWTDFFQGLMMLAALLATPIGALLIMNLGSFTAPTNTLPAGYYHILVSGKLDWKAISDIISGLGWGLGYFGMPHIIVRYISIKNEKEMRKSQIIGCGWIFLILLLACVVGLTGRAYLGDALTTTQDGNTLVFINMVRNVCAYIGNAVSLTSVMLFLAGLLLSAILASAMSTADSQLLASSSAFASDLYKPIFRKNAGETEMLWAGRAIVLVISIVAFFIAASPECKGIMKLVSCAWAAFGSAFGPVVILALYWKRLTYNGAFAGIVVGFAMNIVWYNLFAAKTGIYEIVPGFAVGFITTYVVSLIDKAPSAEVVELFNKAKEQTADVENNKVTETN